LTEERRLPMACFTALVMHAALLLAAGYAPLGPAALRRPIEAIEMDLSRRYEIDVEVPPPVSPEHEPEQVPIGRHATPSRVREPAATRTGSPAADATPAASIVGQEPAPGVPVDLTGLAIVTGKATSYAGGATTSTDTGSSAVRRGPSAAVQGGPGPPAASDRSSAVSLESENWSCPWPREAEAQQIDEQTVVLRVIVDSSGAPERATVLSDPGHGFGAAAAACAMRTRFTPARDRDGQPMRATSPPIRVRFTR
jgi:protein TonB